MPSAGLAGEMVTKLWPACLRITVPAVLVVSDAGCLWPATGNRQVRSLRSALICAYLAAYFASSLATIAGSGAPDTCC
jgi:hypothetical protein